MSDRNAVGSEPGSKRKYQPACPSNPLGRILKTMTAANPSNTNAAAAAYFKSAAPTSFRVVIELRNGLTSRSDISLVPEPRHYDHSDYACDHRPSKIGPPPQAVPRCWRDV